MAITTNIHERREVVGCCGKHVGTVDRDEPGRIKLTADDRNAGGRHHTLPLDWVATVSREVRLNRPRSEVMRAGGWDRP